MLSQDAVIAITVETLVALPAISSLIFIIGFYCGGLYQKRKFINKYTRKKRVILRKPTPPPKLKETYYNVPLSSEQANDVEWRDQRNTKPSCHPAVMYDDVILSTSQ